MNINLSWSRTLSGLVHLGRSVISDSSSAYPRTIISVGDQRSLPGAVALANILYHGTGELVPAVWHMPLRFSFDECSVELPTESPALPEPHLLFHMDLDPDLNVEMIDQIRRTWISVLYGSFADAEEVDENTPMPSFLPRVGIAFPTQSVLEFRDTHPYLHLGAVRVDGIHHLYPWETL